MMLKLVKFIGQPICIALYAASLIKKPILAVALFIMHLSEYFITGRKVGKASGVSAFGSLLKCLAFGFTWWLPLKKEKGDKNDG